MNPGFADIEIEVDEVARTLGVSFLLDADVRKRLSQGGTHSLGSQIYDPESGLFLYEGPWTPLDPEARARMQIELPKEKGGYHVYVSPIEAGKRWLYQTGAPFLLIEASVQREAIEQVEPRVLTLRELAGRRRNAAFREVFSGPFKALARNAGLIRSLARRDVLARYRGSFGDVAWTLLHPLLLMATYFFVFGIVLQARLGTDTSRTGFALYFLAGMIPWLAFSETIGRAPNSILEHRNFVKKLIFPVEILPAVQTASGLAGSLFALTLFVVALLLLHDGGVPASTLALPLIAIPQAALTLGLAWFLAALGVYFRDLAQIMGFVLTLIFFLTPICYPESALPAQAQFLKASPIYAIVRGYRYLLLEGVVPSLPYFLKLWALAAVFFFGGFGVFRKLRRSFADVI
jgi:lipopolysaccharide transport system permease protein